jgi:hypothetical protein
VTTDRAHTVRRAVRRLLAFTLVAYVAYLAYHLLAAQAARLAGALVPAFS